VTEIVFSQRPYKVCRVLPRFENIGIANNVDRNHHGKLSQRAPEEFQLKRTVYLTILLLAASSSPLLTGCMSAEQLAATVKRVKEKRAEDQQNNPEVPVVYAKKDIKKGAIINDDDVEERNVHMLEDHVPEDATHSRQGVILKKAKTDIASNQPICQHELAPLVGR
jgi:Flp pilus assembly protein CpaB